MPAQGKSSSKIASRVRSLQLKIEQLEEILVESFVNIVEAQEKERGEKGEPGKSIKGDIGIQGLQGLKGLQGVRGKNIKGDKGDAGLSIKGDKGDSGLPGEDGIDGIDGKDAARLQLQSNGHIVQWRLEDDEFWKNLFAIPQGRGDGGGGGGALAPGQIVKFKTQVINEITFADSPFTMLHDQDRIYVDTTDGNVIVNLLSKDAAIIKPVHVQKIDISVNTVTVTAKGADTINGASTKVISSQDVDHELVPTTVEWRLS